MISQKEWRWINEEEVVDGVSSRGKLEDFIKCFLVESIKAGCLWASWYRVWGIGLSSPLEQGSEPSTPHSELYN